MSEKEVEKEVFDCACRKCGTTFQSEDQLAAEGDEECPPCKEKMKKIAENVQKIIDQRRAARKPAPPRQDIPKGYSTYEVRLK